MNRFTNITNALGAEISGLFGGPAVQSPTRKGSDTVRSLKGVDPRLSAALADAIDQFEAENPGYTAHAISGYRAGDPRQHGKRRAIDIQIVDPKGNEVKSYQNAKAFRTYESLAQKFHTNIEEQAPDLAGKDRWGGYFSGKKGKYGALDLMHFDLGGLSGLGMAGGTWDKGLTRNQRSLFPGVKSVGMADLKKSIAGADTKKSIAQTMPATSQVSSLGMKTALGTRDFMSANMARVAKAVGTPPSTYAARITAPTKNSSNLMARTAVTPSDARMRPDISARMADTLAGNNSLTGGASADTMAARMSPMEPGANIAHLTNAQPNMPGALGAPNPARFGVDSANQAQAQWERIAPTSQDMALAHLTAPANALGSTFPARPDIIAPNTFSNQPMLKAPELQATVPPQPEIQQPQVSTVKTSSVKRAPVSITVTKPADPFAGKTIGGIKPDERFSVDSIDSAIGGPRGATFSAAPGLATFSRGPNIGYGVHNAKTGMTTLFDPSGNITGARRDKSTSGGFSLGGLFGGGSSSSGSSGRSLGGSSGGGFGIGGAGSTHSR